MGGEGRGLSSPFAVPTPRCVEEQHDILGGRCYSGCKVVGNHVGDRSGCAREYACTFTHTERDAVFMIRQAAHHITHRVHTHIQMRTCISTPTTSGSL